ncbi:MAG: DUF2917 domain-containing protein [Proteobacteria bacterium]|nr:DUF2917 domain-containing protein [Pseudomonadota bacterium]
MDTDLDLELPPGAALTLPPRAALHLHLLSGRLWLTRSGDPDDHFIDPGSRLLLDGRGCVVENDSGTSARLRLRSEAFRRPALRRSSEI